MCSKRGPGQLVIGEEVQAGSRPSRSRIEPALQRRHVAHLVEQPSSELLLADGGAPDSRRRNCLAEPSGELTHAAARFYSDYLPAGHYHLSYGAQAMAEGEFNASPTRAEEMYDPDVYGKGLPAYLTVDGE